MTKHSKNNTASSVFTYAEYKMLDYGTKRQRLGHESMRNPDACALCLQNARDPLACKEGHLFCKECVYEDLLTQTLHIKKQKAKLNAWKEEQEEERLRAREEARERVLLDFERGQLTVSARAGTSSLGGSKEVSDSRGTKRKFEFSPGQVERMAEAAEEEALKRIKAEQAESLKAKLPDFWLPSLVPSYTTKGLPSDLKDIKVRTMCHIGRPAHEISMKSLIPVEFSMFEGDNGEKEPMCPCCKKRFSLSTVMFLMIPCSHVVCKNCVESIVREAKQCVVCDKELKDKDILELKREGTGFASGGLAETSKTGIAFQG